MSKASTHELLTMGAIIQDMSTEKLRAVLIGLAAKHPATALEVVLGRELVKSYQVPNVYIRNPEDARFIEFNLSPAQLEQLKKEWRQGAPPMGNKIGAIKVFRQITGQGLADSKCCIEWLMAQGHIN